MTSNGCEFDILLFRRVSVCARAWVRVHMRTCIMPAASVQEFLSHFGATFERKARVNPFVKLSFFFFSLNPRACTRANPQTA